MSAEIVKELAEGLSRTFDIGSVSADSIEKYIAFKKLEMFVGCSTGILCTAIFMGVSFLIVVYIVKNDT